MDVQFLPPNDGEISGQAERRVKLIAGLISL
jgi:hypothetical protein